MVLVCTIHTGYGMDVTDNLIGSRVIDVSTIELMDLMIDCPLRDAL